MLVVSQLTIYFLLFFTLNLTRNSNVALRLSRKPNAEQLFDHLRIQFVRHLFSELVSVYILFSFIAED